MVDLRIEQQRERQPDAEMERDAEGGEEDRVQECAPEQRVIR
jgi:hypothetical protein